MSGPFLSLEFPNRPIPRWHCTHYIAVVLSLRCVTVRSFTLKQAAAFSIVPCSWPVAILLLQCRYIQAESGATLLKRLDPFVETSRKKTVDCHTDGFDRFGMLGTCSDQDTVRWRCTWWACLTKRILLLASNAWAFGGSVGIGINPQSIVVVVVVVCCQRCSLAWIICPQNHSSFTPEEFPPSMFNTDRF